MENLVNAGFWKGRKVLVTGHTGFKGSWLVLWLRQLGAVVTGFSLEPPTNPNLFTLASVTGDCTDLRGDIADAVALQKTFLDATPEIVFHLAAQPLVRESYRNPRETWKTNVMGTLEVLEACRSSDSVNTVVVITTDKVYENPERGIPFGEDDPFGGYDPYSSSKAACEILCASWRRSFMPGDSKRKIGLATARAGNVIGGGDFAPDRLIPDFVRGWESGSAVRLRYPQALRPWQHVLEPLSGYLLLAECLHGDAQKFSTSYNFGPLEADIRSVGEVADAVCQFLGTLWEHEKSSQPHEAGLLKLSSQRAWEQLTWKPRFRFTDAVSQTCDWYKGWRLGEDMRALTLTQIQNYQTLPPIVK